MRHIRSWVGEALGTFILTLFGCGAVVVSVLFGAHVGLMQVAVVWGVGVMLAIYITRHLSNAHLNPAVSVAMVVSGRMPARKLLRHVSAQFAGAIVAGFAVYLLFNPSIAAFEAANGIVRGSPESVFTAKMFGEFYPNPSLDGEGQAVVSMPLAFGVEAFATFLLVLFIFALTDDCNVGRPNENSAPLLIGLTVTSLICLTAPLTQTGLNPARDFGPRLVSWLMGWKGAAFPANGGAFWVYILAPVVGGIVAALVFNHIITPLMNAVKPEK
ncbi:MAG: aquaporin family protein [Kiritimatiellaeota bacterium]|nr:aquaporin family protein [Kiritimatiellota bacterium]